MRALVFVILVSCQPVIEEPPQQEVASRRQIAAGRFASLGIDGSRDEDGVVVTLRDPDETGGTLSLLPFAGGDGCEAGRAAGFETHGVDFFQGVLLSSDPIRIGAQDTIDPEGTGPFRFVDASCGDSPPVLADALRQAPFGDLGSSRTFFAWTVAGDVLRLDPYEGTSSTIATGVTAFERGWWDPDDDSVTDLLLFLVEDGELVVRAGDGDEITRAGANVQAMSIGCPVTRDGRINYLEGSCPEPVAAYTDDSGLSLLGEDAPIAADACEPQILTGIQSLESGVPSLLPPVLAYRSPCESRTLVLRNLGDGSETTYDDRVSAVRRLYTGKIVYILEGGPAEGVGRAFVVAEPGAEAIEMARDVQLSSVEPYFVGLLALAEFDGTRGNLGIWSELAGFLPTPYPDVVAFDGNTLLAVLHHFEDGVGTLDVVDVVTGASQIQKGEDPIGREPILRAEGVPAAGFRWSETTFALDYLEAFDPAVGAGRLKTWLVPDGATGGGGPDPLTGEEGFLVDEGVAEWLEIQWPDAGEIYVVRDGERDGIWYADWRD